MILIAPDSFKGTFTAAQVAAFIADGVRAAGHQAQEMPVADGGEGTFDALCTALQPTPHPLTVANPWGQSVPAHYGIAGDLGLVELAQASGLHTPHDGPRDPVSATTYGTGELIVAADRAGAQEILVAAGGSATTDGGTGALAAIADGGGITAQITVLTDVTTPFEDAARVFGPQKGADVATVATLTRRLADIASHYPRDPRGIARTGAAGGFSGGLWACYDAQLVSGADRVLDLARFDAAARRADAIIVGEGRLDTQTSQGKIIDAILARAGDTPVYAVVGSVAEDLGDYARRFAGIVVASSEQELRQAYQSVVASRRWA